MNCLAVDWGWSGMARFYLQGRAEHPSSRLSPEQDRWLCYQRLCDNIAEVDFWGPLFKLGDVTGRENESFVSQLRFCQIGSCVWVGDYEMLVNFVTVAAAAAGL